MTPADRYWAQFLESRPFAVRPERPYVEAFSFGMNADLDDGESAQEIADLVIAGTKSATGSLLWAYEHDDKPLPAEGDHWIVLGRSARPTCVIETNFVEVLPFDEVPALYARLGGEGDRSVEHWRALYWHYIERECERIGRAADRRAPLVMEHFTCVYDEPAGFDA